MADALDGEKKCTTFLSSLETIFANENVKTVLEVVENAERFAFKIL